MTVESILRSALFTDSPAALTTNNRYVYDIANAENYSWIDLFFHLQYGALTGVAGSRVAEIFLLYSDSEGTPVFPVGGDGTGGTIDVDPQRSLIVGALESRNPSLTVNETLLVRNVPIAVGPNRLVVKNLSGQTFNSGWQITGKRSTRQFLP